MAEWKDNLRVEVVKGGSEAPCPFCGTPRVRRSDYIRCHRCATNWLDGEDLRTDPREARRNKFLDQIKATRCERKPEDPARKKF